MSNLESYKHRFAKDLLASWIRDAAKEAKGYEWTKCGLRASPNRGEPLYGVHTEYPICAYQVDGHSVWDEEGWHYDYHKKFGSFPEGAIPDETVSGSPYVFMPRPPTRNELLKLGTRPLFILDIACMNKGSIAFGIEVIHKNVVSSKKVELLNQCDFPTLVVSSDWILSQVSVPKKLVLTEGYCTRRRAGEVDLGTHVKDFEWSRSRMKEYVY